MESLLFMEANYGFTTIKEVIDKEITSELDPAEKIVLRIDSEPSNDQTNDNQT